MDLKAFLNENGFSDYIDKFIDEHINMELLPTLTQDDLRLLGMKLGDIKRLISLVHSETLKNNEQQPQHIESILKIADTFPFVVAFPLYDYVKDDKPKLILWDMCDFTELLLRFVVIVLLADIRAKKTELPISIVNECHAKIEQPTLGKWLGIARAVVRDQSADTDIVKTVTKVINPFVNGSEPSDEYHSLLKLRNHLAHGGSISNSVAAKLSRNWQPQFETFLRKLDWLSKCKLIVKQDNNYLLLNGNLNKQTKPYPMNKEENEKLGPLFHFHHSIVFKNDMELLPLWPLIFYSHTKDCTEYNQNIYVRRGDIFLEYTPVGSSEVCQVESGKEELNEFKKVFKLDNLEDKEKENKFIITSFEREIMNDFKKMNGRKKELTYIKEMIRHHGDNVYWLTGNAGIGKSFLMASLSINAKEAASDRELILSYRFKAGDERCNSKSFIVFAIERLLSWDGVDTVLKKQPFAYKIEDLKQCLSDVKESYHVAFYLDGLDEIPEKEMQIAKEICRDLKTPRVVWLCSSRINTQFDTIINDEKCIKLYADGLPKMTKQDVQSMIYEKIGLLRKKIVRLEKESDNKVINPFIDLVWKNSEGLPLYVAYVIGDILSNRIKSFSENQLILPPSIYAYHQELISRCSVGLYSQILPRLIATISIAKEALTSELIRNILIKENFLINNNESQKIIRNSLTYVAPMLRRVSTNDANEEGFILYHKSLLDFMNENHETQQLLTTARKSLLQLIHIDVNKLSMSVTDRYLLKWGIVHLLEDNEDHSQKILKLLSSFPYMKMKFNNQQLELFFDDLNASYQNVIESSIDASSILAAFLNLIKDQFHEQATELTLENVHSLCMYRHNLQFYEDFLNYALSELKHGASQEETQLYAALCLRMANLQRRKGNLKFAIHYLTDGAAQAGKDKNFKELQRVEYDRGYIEYLRGHADVALLHFNASREFAKQANDEVGYWISYCVQMHTAQFATQSKIHPDQFIMILHKALPKFIKNAQLGNENAKRWIKDVYAHLFKAAFNIGDAQMAEENYAKLTNNHWITKFDSKFMMSYKAKLYALRGDRKKAIDTFQTYIKDPGVNGESVASDFLELAKLLYEDGQIMEAKLIAEKGLKCPQEFGNSYFFGDLKKIVQKCIQP